MTERGLWTRTLLITAILFVAALVAYDKGILTYESTSKVNGVTTHTSGHPAINLPRISFESTSTPTPRAHRP